MVPVESRARPGVRFVTQQVDPPVEFEQRFQQPGRIVVVHPLHVSLAVARGHKLLDPGKQILAGLADRPRPFWWGKGGRSRRVFARHLFNGKALGCGEGLVHLIGQVFGAVHLRVLGDQFLAPRVAGGQESRIGDGLEKVGSGQVILHFTRLGARVFAENSQVEVLHVDREGVLAQANHILAVDEQLLAVLQLPDGVFADGFQAALDVVGLHGFVHRHELIHQVADFADHQVGGEVPVDFVDFLENGDAVSDSLQNAVGGGHQAGGFLVARFRENELLGFEGVVEFFPFVG